MRLLVALLVMVVSQVHGHKVQFGACPNVPPMEDFNMNKFLGKWYVIEKTSTKSSCLTELYTKDDSTPGRYHLEQLSRNLIVNLATNDSFHYNGYLTVPNNSNPGSMRAKFEWNVAGEASYIIFTTDYTTYAGVYTCQKLPLVHRRSASILSRTPTLDSETVKLIHEKLAKFEVGPSELDVISRDDCPEESSSSGGNWSNGKKVEDVFKDGFATVVNSTKTFFNNVRGDHGESREEINTDSTKRDMKADAEWVY